MENVEVQGSEQSVSTTVHKPKRNAKGQILPGETGNPNGRPKGRSIKDMVREWLDNNPNDMEEFVKHFVKENRSLAWQMLEGRPQQDVTTGGEKLPTPLLANLNVSDHDSDKENIEAKEEN